MTPTGLIGLGKMGFNLGLNLLRNGYALTAYDLDAAALGRAGIQGMKTASSPEELARQLPAGRFIWLMVPAGPAVDQAIELLLPELDPGDVIVDGGNSNFKDSIRRHGQLLEKGIHFLDCGTSGGVSGALNGVCAMIGGDAAVFAQWEHLFKAISLPDGYRYCGKAGSGHFVKMVHNGIEYGMMQAMAEGFELLEHSGFSLDLPQIAKLWNQGSVIRGWLLELLEQSLSEDPHLDRLKGVMHASGEGRWAVETGLDLGIPTPVMALSLMMRYRSQQEDTFSGKVVAALRHAFGGHAIETKD